MSLVPFGRIGGGGGGGGRQRGSKALFGMWKIMDYEKIPNLHAH